MGRGICKMCLHERELQSSHLMPSALYGYCRRGDHKAVFVGHGVVIPTDRELQDYLLCKDCEGLLNLGGEDWMLDKLATYEKAFPLHELVA